MRQTNGGGGSPILVAEDHFVSRHLLERHLSNWGFRVLSAQDGVEALRVLESEAAPSLAILDWMMPKLDGLEICRRVRVQKNRPYIYLLILTARSRRDEIIAGLEAGADDYIIKPFEPDELRARLKVGQRVVALERTLAHQKVLLERALGAVRRLKGMLLVCSHCRRVRDAQNRWQAIEKIEEFEKLKSDFPQKSIGDFTHDICPECQARLGSKR